MNNNRPKEIDDILLSIRYWNKSHLIYFLNNFIELNCDKVKLWLTNYQISETISSYSENELKSQIILLIQNIKKEDNIIIPIFTNKNN